ncbi:metallophosphoesterase [Deinococcus sp. Arct2-2]|uniref:metallophosphatase domain-containing protein n=1 Tax=Deinococcus sp. Arct2-2 TaxID=2568653 RepID=UPI0010A3B324|nr:metallophosphatase domain-containing protein [Deinococcus sp. Arct2-2]THF69328.1 metallophosphoesterase [Deinococcus sp. Arct2-2]
MKIVCISDTHNLHDTVVVPDGDVLVHAGDYSMQGHVAETQAFLTWFASQPHRHKVFVAGNHDFIFEKREQQARAMVPPGVIYLDDEGMTLEGVRFWGSPVTPFFHHWAFNRHPSSIGRSWDLIPDDTDVLITHGPPSGRLDRLASGQTVGCPQLWEALETRLRPRLHVFGHIHEGYGQVSGGGRTSVNASIVDEYYRPANAPVVVTL